MPQRVEDAFEPFPWEAGPGGDRDPRSFQHLVRLGPREEVAELVGADQEDRINPFRVRTQRLDGARMVVDQDLVVRECSPCQFEAHSGWSVDVFVAGISGDEHDEPVETELGLRAPCELDMTAMGRVERTAEQPQHQASSNSSSPISTVAPSFAPAARNARSSSSSEGGVPSTRKPSSVRSRRQPRAFGCGR